MGRKIGWEAVKGKEQRRWEGRKKRKMQKRREERKKGKEHRRWEGSGRV